MSLFDSLFARRSNTETVVEEAFDSARSCCFTGHRDIPAEMIPQLEQRLRDGITYLRDTTGIVTFLAGGALGFDTLAAEAVLACRCAHPDISLMLVLPCGNQTARWKPADVERYEAIKEAADKVICLSERYYDGCMQARNRYLVDHCAACICYLTRSTGGTAYTVQYAREKGLKIYNLSRPKSK